MCLEDRNTLSRGRPPATALIVRLTRALRRSSCLLAMASPVSLPPLLLLAFLTEDEFTRIPHALALVGLGRTEAADFRCDLADSLLVDAGHDDFGRSRRDNRDSFRNWIDHVVAEPELDLEILSLDRGAVTDAGDLELALETLGHARHQVGDLGARRPPHGACA